MRAGCTESLRQPEDPATSAGTQPAPRVHPGAVAAALLTHYAGDRVVVRSAGTVPAESINPAVVEVMAGVGIDLVAAGARPMHLEDSAGQGADAVRSMRDEIDARVREPVAELFLAPT